MVFIPCMMSYTSYYSLLSSFDILHASVLCNSSPLVQDNLPLPCLPLKNTEIQMIFIFWIFAPYSVLCGPGSSVGIVTGYGLDSPGIKSQWEARFSAPVQTGPGAHPASCTIGTSSFQGVKSGQSVTLTLHPLLVPWSWKSRAIPLLPLWAVQPVQSLSACTRVHFTFTLQ